MTLKIWRKKRGITLSDAAQKCGLGGHNPARTFQRYETGESGCSLEVVIRIEAMTDGVVTLEDMRNIRLAYLNGRKANLSKSAAPVTRTQEPVVR